jgi:hypothetical protein
MVKTEALLIVTYTRTHTYYMSLLKLRFWEESGEIFVWIWRRDKSKHARAHTIPIQSNYRFHSRSAIFHEEIWEVMSSTIRTSVQYWSYFQTSWSCERCKVAKSRFLVQLGRRQHCWRFQLNPMHCWVSVVSCLICFWSMRKPNVTSHCDNIKIILLPVGWYARRKWRVLVWMIGFIITFVTISLNHI